MKTLRKERVRMLTAIRTLSEKSEFHLASIEAVQKRLKVTYAATSIMLYRMKKHGLVENPMRGYYRLTKKGQHSIESVEEAIDKPTTIESASLMRSA